MPRHPDDRCDITWDDRYGTTYSGNLPQWERTVCIEDAIDLATIQNDFPWVKYTNFHYYSKRCPYSNEAALNYTRNITPADANYWELEVVLPGNRSNHTSTVGMMIRHSRGSRHGWLCVDPDCAYYTNNKALYFHI